MEHDNGSRIEKSGPRPRAAPEAGQGTSSGAETVTHPRHLRRSYLSEPLGANQLIG